VPAGIASLTVADPSGPASLASAIYDSVFTALNCKNVVKVPLLPDSAATGPRVSEGAAIWRELQMLMPQHELRTCMCVGPFVDDYGHAAFFDKSKKYLQKQITLDTKRDLLTSVAAVLRSIAIHQPDIVVGSGQGGAVAIALASPLLLEVCLAARNFKLPELRAIAPAWSKVKQIVAIQPRLARKDPIGPMFRLIAPELFDQELQKSSPSPEGRWGHASVLGVIPRNYRDTSVEDLFRELDIPVGTSMGAISWDGVMDRRPRLMWEHEGQCQCGRKTYLAGQCRKCALEDAEERHVHRERQAAQDAELKVGDYELVVPAPGSQPVAHTDSEHDCVVAWLDKSSCFGLTESIEI
jgi:hypothetical protein